MKKQKLTRRQKMQEREVLARLRRDRVVSIFWLQESFLRCSALTRLEARGVVSVFDDGYPHYRVVIHRKRGGS